MPIAIVTGASRGLGRAVAEALVGEGWSLVVDARGGDDLRRLGERLRTGGATVIAEAGDVADERHRRALVRAAHTLGGLDVVVNNASDVGPTPLPRVDAYPVEAIRRVFEVNVVAPLRLLQLARPLLQASRGAVVNISSDAAVEAYEGWGGYGASKAALEQLSNVFAAENPEIRTYWVDPGDMDTDMHRAAAPDDDPSSLASPDAIAPVILRLLRTRPPSGRVRASDLLAASGDGIGR